MNDRTPLKPSAREVFAQESAKIVRRENTIADRVTRKMADFLDKYYQQREEDCLKVITEHFDEIDGDMSKLSQIMQEDPDGSGHVRYRGIQLNGRFVIDHYPDWPIQPQIS